MNNLSWFLYFAEMADRVVGMAVLVSFIACFVWFITPPKGVEPFSSKHSRPFMGWHRAKPLVILSCVLILAAFLISSKETIYLIAGSEGAEAVVTSQEGKEILSDIKDVIRHQLDSLKGN